MGGERAATARARLAGRICCSCRKPLSTPPYPGERYCDSCEVNKPRHRILMNFMPKADGWHLSFLEADCKTSLPCKLVFANVEKVVELARRGSATLDTHPRVAAEHFERQGAIWLSLTPSQYRALW